MTRCVLTILCAALLLPGCIRKRNALYDSSTPRYSRYNQYTADDFDWTTIQRVLVMPFGNRSSYPQVPEQIRTALAAELQQAGRFEIVVAPLDVEATSSKEVLSTGRFDELEALRISRRYQAQAILYGVVTQYHPYSPPRIGVSLLMVSPAEAVVVASVDGLFDSREQSTVDAAADYYDRTQSFPLSLLGSDRVTESPDVFRRFVSHEIAKSLASLAAPSAPPGRSDQDPAATSSRLTDPVRSNEDRQGLTDPQMVPTEQPYSTTPWPAAGPVPRNQPGGDAQGEAYGRMPESGSRVAWHENREPLTGQSDTRVTHVFMNPRLTGGHNFDIKPGDDGIRVVIEPRNADGQFVPRGSALSIMAFDLAERGAAARVGRWDLNQSQLAPLLQTSEAFGRGFHLHLLWPGDPPRRPDLRLVAMYVTEDGRRLEADQMIFVDLPNRSSVNHPPLQSVQPPLVINPPHPFNPVHEADPLPVLAAPALPAEDRQSVPSAVERHRDHTTVSEDAPRTTAEYQGPDIEDRPPQPPQDLSLPPVELRLRSSRANTKNRRGYGQQNAEISQNPGPFLPNSSGTADSDGQNADTNGRILIDPSAVRPDIAFLSPSLSAKTGKRRP